ncbi:efflux RND transporter periplasmic adaptor subunit [Alcaligenaceae bacterium]|nr:efflux RND transporter periplasmic adaptor subunit [Alcaligenaceae bacterium]
MKRLPLTGRTLALIAIIVPLLITFVYVGLRSGPLAPVAVTVATVEAREITPSLFGIGTVEARHTHHIGPTYAGRIKSLSVHVGDRVTAGQLLGEMDPIDLNDRVRSQASNVKRAEAALREAQARHTYAQTQARRYQQLHAVRSASEESLTTKRQELQIADASLSAAAEELNRARSDYEGLVAQQASLRLIAPVDGIVAARDADPGTTIVAGQNIIEIIDPKSLWVNARFDQIHASGLAAALPAHIVLRSRKGDILKGRVQHIEPKADAITEEMLAKVIFDTSPDPLPSIGELAEITVVLPALPVAPSLPNAAIQRQNNIVGSWLLVDGKLRFAPIKLGAFDLDGYVQVREGLKNGDQVVAYSEKALTARSRIHILDHMPGVIQ